MLHPILNGWIALHNMTDGTQIAILEKSQTRFAVVALQGDQFHQLPVFSTEDSARKAYWTMIKEYWAAQDQA